MENLVTPYHKFTRFDRRATTNEIKLTPDRRERLKTYFTHGLLSTHMVRALVDPDKTQEFVSTELKRLRRIPNSYLTYSTRQEDDLDVRSNPNIFGLAHKSIEPLITAGTISIEDAQLWQKLRAAPKENQFWHDRAASHVTASIELGAKKLGLEFISVYDIIRNAPEKTKNAQNPLAIPYEKSFFIPDALFGLRDGPNVTYFALEMDMGNEQNSDNNLKHSTLAKKYRGYRNMLYRELHTTHFGIPNLKILFATTKPLKTQNLKKLFKDLADQDTRVTGVGPFYLRCFPELDYRNHIRVHATPTALTDPWERVTAEPTYLHKKRITQ
jgi:hypothetical protein